jgi:hypothetical protein
MEIYCCEVPKEPRRVLMGYCELDSYVLFVSAEISASVITSKAANGYHVKSGQRE